ncbi:MAG: hypothetical protein GF317_19510 [Candidatus Lokiarchaeota archaeon]|nr:hypothetical protein [Candidatus Lokiarchaeota archaeon]MBD3201684.1 hypothetical protein [Candidatus Lokiarchaeota archaeon]
MKLPRPKRTGIPTSPLSISRWAYLRAVYRRKSFPFAEKRFLLQRGLMR